MKSRHSSSFKMIALCGTGLVLVSCASTPMGPTVRAMPSQGKPFENFQIDQNSCKQYAADQVRGQADEANSTGLLEGIGGTVLGAGLGAAIGGGQGAAIGAGAGALGGTAVGASTSSNQQRGIQKQYNDAYVQCMVAKGNQIEQPVYMPPAQTTIIYSQPQPPPVIYALPPPQPMYAPPPY
jgi:uncharacterized protein YcfJ